MVKKSILNIVENGKISKALKEAYAFMLLSRGYTADEIKILDDYVFMIRKKGFKEEAEIKDKSVNHRRENKRSLPKNLVCYNSTSDAYNRRDHTLYSLNGTGPFTKGRFVWSIIKLYQQENNPTFEEVKELFNFKLHLLRNTVVDESSLALFNPDKRSRYYNNELDLLESKDGIRYAVSNQWSINKMDAIISFAYSYGWKVDIIKH